MVEEADAPSPTVYLSSTIHSALRGGSLPYGRVSLGTSCPRANCPGGGTTSPRAGCPGGGGQPPLGQDVPGGILRGGTTCTTTPGQLQLSLGECRRVCRLSM